MDVLRWMLRVPREAGVEGIHTTPRAGVPSRGELSIAKLAPRFREFSTLAITDEVVVVQVAMSPSDALDFVERANATLSRHGLSTLLAASSNTFEAFPFRNMSLIKSQQFDSGAEPRTVWTAVRPSLVDDYLRALEDHEGGNAGAAHPRGARVGGPIHRWCANADDGGAGEILKEVDAEGIKSGAQGKVYRGRVRHTKQRYSFAFREDMVPHQSDGDHPTKSFDVRSFVQVYKGSETVSRSGLRVVIKRFPVAEPTDPLDSSYVECLALGFLNEVFRRRLSPAAFCTYAIARTACGSSKAEQLVVMQDLGYETLDTIQREIAEGKHFPRELEPRAYHALIAQLCVALSALQTTLGLVHGDLHTNNIMITRVPVSSTLTFRYKDHLFDIPTFGFVVRIMDFGFSSMNLRDGDRSTRVYSTISGASNAWRKGMSRSSAAFDLPYAVTAILKHRLVDDSLGQADPVWRHIQALARRSFHRFDRGGIHTWGWNEAVHEVFADKVHAWTAEDRSRIQSWFFKGPALPGETVMPFGTPKAWLFDADLSILAPYMVKTQADQKTVYPILSHPAWDMDPQVERELRKNVDTEEFRRAKQSVHRQYLQTP
jgi:hypothetical protein